MVPSFDVGLKILSCLISFSWFTLNTFKHSIQSMSCACYEFHLVFPADQPRSSWLTSYPGKEWPSNKPSTQSGKLEHYHQNDGIFGKVTPHLCLERELSLRKYLIGHVTKELVFGLSWIFRLGESKGRCRNETEELRESELISKMTHFLDFVPFPRGLWMND